MAGHDVDLLDGYDSSQVVYDEKQEKKYHAGIWICIAFCMGLVLIRGIVFHIEEIYQVASWQCIEADYNEETMYATYKDADGVWYQYNVSGLSPVHDGNKIKLYYEEDMRAAEPVSTLSFWLGAYALLGGLIGFSVWRIVRIYKGKKKHGTE